MNMHMCVYVGVLADTNAKTIENPLAAKSKGFKEDPRKTPPKALSVETKRSPKGSPKGKDKDEKGKGKGTTRAKPKVRGGESQDGLRISADAQWMSSWRHV